LRILVECAAILGIADKLDPEGFISSPDELAMRASKLINACELCLRGEAMQADLQVAEQLNKLEETRNFSKHLSFDEGTQALLNLKDPRRERLEDGIKRLLKSDFESNPREPRSASEHRRLRVSEDNKSQHPPDLVSFINGELTWHKTKGFTPEDLKRLSAHRRSKGTDR